MGNKEKSIFDLELHEVAEVSPKLNGKNIGYGWLVTRVPSGFIYQENVDTSERPTDIFVPYEEPINIGHQINLENHDGTMFKSATGKKVLLNDRSEADGWTREMYPPKIDGLYLVKAIEGFYEVVRWSNGKWDSPMLTIVAWKPFTKTNIKTPF